MYTPKDFYVDMNKVINKRNKEISDLEGIKLRTTVLEIVKAAIDSTPIKGIVEVKNGTSYFPICYTENGLELGIGSAVIAFNDEDGTPYIQLLICHNKDDEYDKKDVIDIALTSLADAQSKAISGIEEEIESLNKKHQELSEKLIMINDMRLKSI